MTKTRGVKKPPTASATVFVDYHVRLTQYIVKRIDNPEDANDLVQEVYEQFVRADRARCADVIKDPLKYLYGIAAHVVYDHLKSAGQQRSREVVDSEMVESLNEQLLNARPDYLAERLSDERSLHRALAGLPKTHHRVLVMISRDGLSYSEVAQALQLSLDTVKKYAHQAKSQLRTQWKRDDGR